MQKRTVFEEVSGPKAAPVAKPARQPARRAISIWLWLLAALVAAMVLVGGSTRLTDSGLSITEWEPVMGALPPLSDAAWDRAFEAYKGTTEFQKQNYWMTLADFKPLFWWEWGHRLLGRAIGVVWAVGFLGFLAARAIPSGWTGRLLLPGVLGGVQGALGWWMVESGLTGRLDVAPYRLMMHLGLAFAIFAVLIWLALRVPMDEVATLSARRRRVSRAMAWSGWVGALVFFQILAGALVAGLDAGQAYVDWPWMEGHFIPPEAFDLAPAWKNAFENPALVQFDHRMIAYALVVLVALMLWRGTRTANRAVRNRLTLAGLIIFAQAALGVATVMHAAPIWLALPHQAGALIVAFVLVLARFTAAYPPEQRIER